MYSNFNGAEGIIGKTICVKCVVEVLRSIFPVAHGYVCELTFFYHSPYVLIILVGININCYYRDLSYLYVSGALNYSSNIYKR